MELNILIRLNILRSITVAGIIEIAWHSYCFNNSVYKIRRSSDLWINRLSGTYDA